MGDNLDIVTSLRVMADWQDPDFDLMKEAADEIERLRKQVDIASHGH